MSLEQVLDIDLSPSLAKLAAFEAELKSLFGNQVLKVNGDQVQREFALLKRRKGDLFDDEELKLRVDDSDFDSAEAKKNGLADEVTTRVNVVGGEEFDDIVDQVERIDRLTADVDFTADTADLETAVDAVERLTDQVVKIDFDADTESVREGARLVEQLDGATARIRAEVETSDLENASQLVERLDQSVRIRAQVDTSELAQAVNLAGRVPDSLSIRISTVGEEELREAFRLASNLDDFTATIDADTDLSELQAGLRLAEQLDSFTAFIDVDVERSAIREALNLAESLDGLNAELTVRARTDSLEEAKRLADDLDQTVTTRVEVDDADLRDLAETEIEIPVDIDTGDIAAQLLAGDWAGIGTDIGGRMRGGLVSTLTSAGPWGIAGAAVGGLLVTGLADGIQRQRASLELAIQTGFDAGQMREVGSAASEAYVDGFGDSVAEVKQIAATIEGELSGIDPGLDLSSTTKQFQVLSDVIGVELRDSIELTQRLIATGLVGDTQEALNLLTGTAQEFGNSFDEVFEVLKEFTPVFSKLGVDGAQAAFIIGDAWRDGLLPNIDRGAELFEEFNIRLTDGTARDAIQALGVDFDAFSDRVARGDGASALADIADALLLVGDEAQRNALSIEIFGASIESAADPEAVLELLATADQIRDVGDASEEAAAKIENSLSAGVGARWRNLTTDIQKANVALAKFAEEEVPDQVIEVGIDVLTLGLLSDLRGELDNNKEGFEFLAEEASKYSDAARDASEASRELNRAGALGDLNQGRDQLIELDDAAVSAARSLEDMNRSIGDVLADIDLGFRFNTDSVLRDVEELGDKIEATFAEIQLDEVFDVSGNINIATEAGRSFQVEMEKVARTLSDVSTEFANGNLTPDQYVDSLASVEEAFRSQAEAAGLTGQQIDVLAAKYLDLPSQAVTELLLEVDTRNAKEFRDFLNDLPEEEVVRLGIDVDSESAVEAVRQAQTAFAELDPTLQLGFDVDRDGFVTAIELARQWGQLREDAAFGFDVDADGLVDASEQAAAFARLEYFANLGFDTDLDGFTSAREQAESFALLEQYAVLGFDLNQDGLVEGVEAAARFEAERYLADLGYEFDEQGLIVARETGRSWEDETWTAVLAADEERVLKAASASRSALEDFTANPYAAELSVDTTNAESAVDALAVSIDTDVKDKTVIINADASEGLRSTGNFGRDLEAVVSKDYTAKIDADNSQALRSTGEFGKEALRVVDREYEARLTGDNSDALTKTQRAKEAAESAAGLYEINVVARDNASGTIDYIARNRTVYITTRTSGSTRLYGYDGGIIDSSGAIAMRDGGVLDGIAPARRGGVHGVFNGTPFVMAENGGDELFINSRSRVDRQIGLIEKFANGRLDRDLKNHYQGDLQSQIRSLATAVKRLATASTQTYAPVHNWNVATPVQDTGQAARDIYRQVVAKERQAASKRLTRIR